MKTAFESFVEPARARSGMWRLLFGLGCIAFGLLAIGLAIWLLVVLVGFLILDVFDGMSLGEALDAVRPLLTSSDSWGLIFQCFLFSGVWASVWLVVRFLHKRRFSTLIAPAGNFRLRDFFDGLSLAFALWLASILPAILYYGLPDRSVLTLSTWIIALPPMIVGLVIQAGAEELVFRGYLLQQLAARWRSPVVWAGVASVLFIFIHEMTGDFLHIAFLFTFGLVSAALVWRRGSLVTSIGLHFGVNFLIFNGIGFKWDKADQSQLFAFREATEGIGMVSEVTATILLLLFIVSPFFPPRQSVR